MKDPPKTGAAQFMLGYYFFLADSDMYPGTG